MTINGRDEVKIKNAAGKMSMETGAQVVRLAGDISLPEIPKKLVKGTAGAFSGQNILITTAGGPPPGSIDSLDEAAWQKGVDLCLMLHTGLGGDLIWCTYSTHKPMF